MATELKQMNYFLLRYVPDAVKEEFVNIGVVVLGPEGPAVRIADDLRRVRCIDPTADLEFLQALGADLELHLTGPDHERFLAKLNDSLSGSLQLTSPKGLLGENAQSELARLSEMYLNSRRHGTRDLAASAPEKSRAAIVQQMRSAFTDAGVWNHAKARQRWPVAQYTHPGDPLKLDFGYRPNGAIKFFHAVSLEADPDAAKVLAYSFPQVREGLARDPNEHATASLTVITEPDLDHTAEPTAFALSVLSAAEIAVATTSDLAALVTVARTELRL